MATSFERRLGALVMSLLVAQVSAAYERPLSSHSIREAYFLGRRRDDKTAEFLARYVRRFPVPKRGPHVAEIGIRTPYEQMVVRAGSAPEGYSSQQAEQDYRAQPDSILVRARIYLTPTYSGLIPDSSGVKAQVRERPEDFWRDFQIYLIQEKPIAPRAVRGRAIYSTRFHSVHGLRGLAGAEVEWEFDAAQISSAPVRVEVLTPDGHIAEAEFDLSKLR